MIDNDRIDEFDKGLATAHSNTFQDNPSTTDGGITYAFAIAPRAAYRRSGYRAARIAERGSESVATGL